MQDLEGWDLTRDDIFQNGRGNIYAEKRKIEGAEMREPSACNCLDQSGAPLVLFVSDLPDLCSEGDEVAAAIRR